MVVLEKILTEVQWLQFFNIIFCSNFIQKIGKFIYLIINSIIHFSFLGFGFEHDLSVIRNNFPFISKLEKDFSNITCLFKFVTKVYYYLKV